MFADCLHPNMTYAEQPMDAPGHPYLHQVVEEVADDMDVALKNLVGDGAADLAKRWAENGKLRQRLEIVRTYLGPMENSVLDGLLGVKPTPPEESGVHRDASFSRNMSGKGKEKAVMRFIDSEDESDDGFSEDERGKTAHQLFASLAGIEQTEHVWWVSSPASQKRGTRVLDELGAKKAKSTKDSSPISGDVSTGAPWAKRLTPASSPVHASSTRRPLPPRKRKQHPASTPLSCTPPDLRKRLFAEDRAPGSPIHITSLRARSCSIPDTISTDPHEQSTAGPVASSGRLPSRTQQHRDPPLSPLLEVNNYSPERIGSLAPPSTCETHTALKQKVPDTGRSIIHFSSGDENLASDVSRSARIVGEFHRSPSPHQRPAARGITPPNNLSSEMKDKNLRASNLRARRSKLNAHRLGIAERLARARPDLVAPTYEAKRAVLLARDVKARERAQAKKMGLQKEMIKAHLEATGTVSSIEMEIDDGGMV
jgi:DNA cross-link repair 1C protein